MKVRWGKGAGQWYAAQVLASAEDSIRVHYLGWSKKWDEVIHNPAAIRSRASGLTKN